LFSFYATLQGNNTIIRKDFMKFFLLNLNVLIWSMLCAGMELKRLAPDESQRPFKRQRTLLQTAEQIAAVDAFEIRTSQDQAGVQTSPKPSFSLNQLRAPNTPLLQRYPTPEGFHPDEFRLDSEEVSTHAPV
jgi:hypothetical protein